MLALSFRTKLVVAMSVVVAGVTGATMFVTERRVQETYQRLFEDQFQGQVGYFSEKQEARLESVTTRCQELAGSARLISAVRKGDADLIYENVFTELRDLIRSLAPGGGPGGTNTFSAVDTAGREYLREVASNLAERGTGGGAAGPGLRRPPGSPGGPSGPGGGPGGSAGGPARRGDLPMIRVVNAQGEVFPTSDQRAGLLGRMRQSSTETIKNFVGRFIGGRVFAEQEVGYLALENEDDRTHLREFVVTPIIDPAGNQVLGALIIGFPLTDVGEQFLFDFTKGSSSGRILSGIWLEGRIHSQTIPEEAREGVACLVGEHLAPAPGRPPADGELTLAIDGVTHRAFLNVLNPNSPFPPAAQVCLYSLAAVQAEQRDLRWRIGGFGAVALAGALGLILLISHGLTVPIRELVSGTGEIRRGNFNVKVPVRSRDEIGHLAASFNEMAEGLALSRRYQTVLAQVADKEVAAALMRGAVALGGETREISVLFCDIRGFTALTQKMPPAGVIQMLNEHMTALTAVVYEHHGVVDKFVGDLIMAVFGAPKSYGSDAANAARCALRMMEERRRLNRDGRHRIDVGIGLATGEVVAGCMGSADRLNYTVLGERVNLAARLCSSAARGEVLIDDTTVARLGTLAIVEAKPDLLLKGFATPVKYFHLSGMAEEKP